MGTEAQTQNSYTFDAENLLHDAAAITATGAGQVSAAAKEIDFGNLSPGTNVLNVAYTRADLVIDVRAFDFGNGDETAVLVFQLGTVSGFGSGTIVNRDAVPFGLAGGLAGSGADNDSATGRVVVAVDNQHKGTIFRFARLFAIMGGTTPSIEPFAFLSDLR